MKINDVSNKRSFTLIELLIVLALISILASILIVILKPGEILKRSRDTKRISDLNNLDKLIQLMSTYDPNFNELNYASSNIVYISLQDSNSNCSSYQNQLPPLPSGWSYRCSPNPQNIDGTGWIPIPFNTNPLININKLPIDPINKPPYYYSFVVGGSYAFYFLPENPQQGKNDQDNHPHLYSSPNSNKNLIDKAQGLVGYWSFDEGTGTIAYDYSGNNNHGTLYNGPQWTTGKVGGALSFDGVNDYVGGLGNFGRPNTLTISLWFKTTLASWDIIFGQTNVGTNGTPTYYNPVVSIKGTGALRIELWTGGIGDVSTSFNVIDNNWHHVIIVGNVNTQSLYVDGKFIGSRSGTIQQSWWLYSFIGTGYDTTSRGFPYTGWHYFNGLIDEVRIYNRALSPEEIKAIYEATK